MAIRPEVLQKILSDADKAEPISGTVNVYDPENYNKIRARQEAMSKLNEVGRDGYMEEQIGEGAIEFNPNGTLKSIARTQPKVIDPRRLTANRYAKQTVPAGTLGLRPGTDILFAFGGAVIQAFENTTLTPQVKVYRFHYNTSVHDWQFVRAELVEDKFAYSTMTSSLDGASALHLIHLIENDTVKDTNIDGDSQEKNSGEGLTDEPEEAQEEPKKDK